MISLCGDKTCVPQAHYQNYEVETEVEEVQALPVMITTGARGVSFYGKIWI